MMQTRPVTHRDTMLNVVFLVLSFIPHIGSLYIIPPLLLVYLIASEKPKFLNNGVAVMMSLWIVLSFVINAIVSSVDSKMIVRSVMTIGIFLFFPFVKSFRIYKMTLLTAALYVLFSQMCYVLHIGPAIGFFEAAYPIFDDRYLQLLDYVRDNAEVGNYSVRYAGLFHNANICSGYYSILMAMVCIEFDSLIKDRMGLVCTVLIAFGVVLCGSRTGMFTIICIILFRFIVSAKKNRNIIGFLIVPILLIGVIFIYSHVSDSSLRVFKIEEGLDDSLGFKFDMLFRYLSNDAGVKEWVFGGFNLDMSKYQMDNDIGYAIQCFGFVFVFMLIAFFWGIYRKLRDKYVIILIPLLWCLSATIIFNYRFIMVYFMLLSLYYQRNLEALALKRINNSSV